MKPGIPWSVKGIEPDVREAAKDAARRSGMTLGEWLNSVILDQSDGARKTAEPRGDAGPKDFSGEAQAPDYGSDTTIRLEEIAHQLSRLAQRDQQSASIRAYEPPGRQRQEVEAINRIISRLDGNERHTADAFMAVNDRLLNLGEQIAEVAGRKPEEVPGYQALEAALRNIVDHIEVSEKRTRESLKTMQDRMGDMIERAAEAPGMQESLPAIGDLESRLNELAKRLEKSEAAGAALPDLVRQELGQLAERVEEVRETSESFAIKARAAAVESAHAELHDIESRILGLLREAQNALAGKAGAEVELQHLREEIANLHRRIGVAAAETASQRDVSSLRAAFEQMSAKMAQGPDQRPLAEMDRRIAELNLRLDRSEADAHSRPDTGDLERRLTVLVQRIERNESDASKLAPLAELERRFADLDRRFEEAAWSRDDGSALAALEQQIAAFGERVAQTERQLGNLETIERAITQLYEGLDQNRNLAREIAEDAASRVAERLLGQQPLPSGPSPELQALEEGLRAVGETAASAESRNQETLLAVHETLEQIVVKLNELEAASASHQQTLAMVQQGAYRVQEQPPSFQPELVQETAELHKVEPANARPGTPLPFPVAPNPFHEAPATQMSPVVAMPPHLAASVLDPAASDDFIEAARRAAHAAAHKVEFTNTASAVEAVRKSVSRKSGFRVPFLKRGPARTPAEPQIENRVVPILQAPGGLAGKRRTLLIAGLVLLAAVSAVTFTMLGGAKSTEPSTIGTPPMPKAEAPSENRVAAIFIDPIAAAAHELFTGSLPPAKDPELAPIAPASEAHLQMPPEMVGSESLRQAAAKGDAKAQFIIAGRYLDGKPVPQDFAKAAYWYREAASRGLPPAQYRIATLFERGKGVNHDLASALLWYERAAAAGNVKAMHNAAVIAAGGKLGAPDYARALKWFSAAAAHGLKDSQFNLAVLYDRGLGTKADRFESLFWYALAGRQNDADATGRAETMLAVLSPEAAARMRKRVADWRPKPPLAEANIVTVTDRDWKYDAAGDETGALPTGEKPAI